jgi:hypothetical protein
MASTMLEEAKVQAKVLVPLLRALREELGAERANRIAWKALEKWRTEVTREWAKSLPDQTSNVERFVAFNKNQLVPIGDAIDWDWLEGETVFEKPVERVEFNITGCRFAQFFRELGEPELGFALLCSFDLNVADEFGKGDVEFKRTQTIMQGADHCDFRYKLRQKGLA